MKQTTEQAPANLGELKEHMRAVEELLHQFTTSKSVVTPSEEAPVREKDAEEEQPEAKEDEEPKEEQKKEAKKPKKEPKKDPKKEQRKEVKKVGKKAAGGK